MNSSEERTAVLNALRLGLYADNLHEIARRAKALARHEQYNVATWALLYLGCVALASCWDDPVDADVVTVVEQTLLPACEEAIRNPSGYATEKLAREVVGGLARISGM